MFNTELRANCSRTSLNITYYHWGGSLNFHGPEPRLNNWTCEHGAILILNILWLLCRCTYHGGIHWENLGSEYLKGMTNNHNVKSITSWWWVPWGLGRRRFEAWWLRCATQCWRSALPRETGEADHMKAGWKHLGISIELATAGTGNLLLELG